MQGDPATLIVSEQSKEGTRVAARTNRTTLSQAWRDKIRTSMLINRLQNHVAGRIEMSATQLRAAEVLLRKTLPDQQATQVSGPDGVPLEMVGRIELVPLGANSQG